MMTKIRNITLNAYFDNNSQIHLIGLQSGMLGLLVTVAGCYIHEVSFMGIMLIGLMSTTMMLTQNYSDRNSLQRLHFGLIFTVVCGLGFSIANFLAESELYSSLCLLLMVPLLALLNGDKLLQNFVFYLVYAFILGLGFKATPGQMLGHAFYFFSGGGVIVLSGYLRIFLRKKYFDRHETLPFVSYRDLLGYQRPDLAFVFILTLTIVAGNILSFHLAINHRYWLPMTALLLLRNDHRLTLRRSVYRVVGSLLGLAIAGLLLLNIPPAILIALQLPLFYLMVITINRHYAVFCSVITLLVISIIELANGGNNNEILIERLLITLVSVALVALSAIVIKYLSARHEN